MSTPRLLVPALVLGLVPYPCQAQRDSTAFRATLHGWAEEMWLRLLDRDGTRGGRLSDQGILQRFQRNIYDDYQVDQISAGFGLPEEYEWYHRERGARYWGGSVSKRDLVDGGDFKVSYPMGHRWSAVAQYNKASSPELARSLVRIGFRHGAERGPFAFTEGTLTSLKPSTDVEVGGGWRASGAEVRLSAAVLDVFNDWIYQGLGVDYEVIDTSLNYERQPLIGRLKLDLPLGKRFRVEAHGAVLRPPVVRVYPSIEDYFPQASPGWGFRQEERYGFAGTLVEWQLGSKATVGGFYTYVRAVTDRRPLPGGRIVDDFHLVERSSQAALYVLARPGPWWRVESWTSRNYRPERRRYRSGGAPDVDYQDRAWTGQAAIIFGKSHGFRADAALEFDFRAVIRGQGQVSAAESLDRNNRRLRFNLGWRFANGSQFLAGARFDLDRTGYRGQRAFFDGAHGRFALFW